MSTAAIRPWLMPTRAAVQRPDLSCAQAVQILEWSAERYGGLNSLGAGEYKSRAFVGAAARAFLEKLDPYKLLWHEQEVQAWARRVQAQWQRVAGGRECGVFAEWVHHDVTTARGRLEAQLQAVAKNAVFGKSSGDDELKKPKLWAADERALQERQAQWALSLAEKSSAKLLVWYHGDKSAAISDLIGELLPSSRLQPNTYFAKSLLYALDPFSTYFSKEEFADFHNELSGGASGVGVRVRKIPQGYYVEKVLADSPAGQSKKVEEGDVITQIDRTSLVSLEDELAKHLFLGPENSRLKLYVQRSPKKSPTVVPLVRKTFAFDDGKITSAWLKNARGQQGILHVVVPSFYGKTGRELESDSRSSADDLRSTLMSELKRSQPEVVVLDLRGNPGGFLEEAVEMGGFFLGDKPVVTVKERHGERVLKEEGAQALYHGPLVVLTDEETASAAEVLAGALKDHGRALVVGSRSTFGKGSVQKLFHLEDEWISAVAPGLPEIGVVKLTTSVFFSPTGHSPVNGGVVPHVVLSEKVSDKAQGKVAEGKSVLPAGGLVRNGVLAEQIDRIRLESKASAALKRGAELRQSNDLGSDALLGQALYLAERFAQMQQSEAKITSRAE